MQTQSSYGQLYSNTDTNTVIKLLLRCKTLWSVYSEVKKILQLVAKQEDIFAEEDGVIAAII